MSRCRRSVSDIGGWLEVEVAALVVEVAAATVAGSAIRPTALAAPAPRSSRRVGTRWLMLTP